MARALGKALRETGQALDRLGRSLQGNYAFREEREWPAAGMVACVQKQRPTAVLRPPPPPAAAHAAAAPCPAVNRHRSLAPLLGKAPALGRDVFVAPSAAVIGDVTLGDNASVFYGSVIRGEPCPVLPHRPLLWPASRHLPPLLQRLRADPPHPTAAAPPQPTAGPSPLARRATCRTAA